LRAESDRVTRTDIRAPVNGIVNRIYINTIGGVVKAGEPIMELTPTDERVVIEARFARMTAPSCVPTCLQHQGCAYDFGIYGTLRGRLTEVSADTVSDERGNRYYRVGLEVDAIPSSYRDNPIMPACPSQPTSSPDAAPCCNMYCLRSVVSLMMRFASHADERVGHSDEWV